MMDKTSGENVVTYLSRLTGNMLTFDTPLCLRSVQRAAFASWARQQQITVRLAVISSSVPFSVRELLTVEGRTPDPPPVAKPLLTATPAPAELPSVGIDIEDVGNLPVAYDYREHTFYQDNFTDSEIAYCVRQQNVRASFCGTWAAKEAILKTGHVCAPTGYLKGIEIHRDHSGRPKHPGCSLSISHTARTAVAICTIVQGRS